MRVIVCGCRDWTDRDAVWEALDHVWSNIPYTEPLTIVHGACPSGADQFAAMWVEHLGLARLRAEAHPAEWSHGRSAGPRRNAKMANIGADLCLAFWDGQSRGTGDMIHAAIRCCIRVEIVPMRRVH